MELLHSNTEGKFASVPSFPFLPLERVIETYKVKWSEFCSIANESGVKIMHFCLTFVLQKSQWVSKSPITKIKLHTYIHLPQKWVSYNYAGHSYIQFTAIICNHFHLYYCFLWDSSGKGDCANHTTKVSISMCSDAQTNYQKTFKIINWFLLNIVNGISYNVSDQTKHKG